MPTVFKQNYNVSKLLLHSTALCDSDTELKPADIYTLFSSR